MQHKTIYFYALMAIKKVRCVHIKTGEIGYNNPEAAYNKFWQKSTGFYPQPEPKAEQFKSELTEKPQIKQNDVSRETFSEKEIKTKINEESKTVQDGRAANPGTNANTSTAKV